MKSDNHAGLWLELVGGSASFSQYGALEQLPPAEPNSVEDWWQGIFRLGEVSSLELSDGSDVASLRFYLHIFSSLDIRSITKFKVTTGFGYLVYLEDASPPMTSGVIVLRPEAHRSIIECIRTGRGTVKLLVCLGGLESDHHGASRWDVKRAQRLIIDSVEVRVNYGERNS